MKEKQEKIRCLFDEIAKMLRLAIILLVIFALVVGEHSYGLTGALLAVPVASIIQVLFLFFKRKAWIAEQPA